MIAFISILWTTYLCMVVVTDSILVLHGEEKKKKEKKRSWSNYKKEREAWRVYRQAAGIYIYMYVCIIYMADLQRREETREREKSRYWFDAIPWCPRQS